MKRLILASQSPRRRMLLDQVGIPFTVIPSNVDETIKENVDPCEFVKVLATRKAAHIADQCAENGIADQCAETDIVDQCTKNGIVDQCTETDIVDQCTENGIADKSTETDIVDKYSETDSAVVLAADTIVVLDGAILGKPKDSKEAFEMLSMLSENWHEVMTGIAMIDTETGARLTHVEKTRVKIRSLTPKRIQNYIDTGEPLDKAGAYGIQGLGALLVEKLDGCYFNVVGLPLYRVSVMLSKMGITSILDGN